MFRFTIRGLFCLALANMACAAILVMAGELLRNDDSAGSGFLVKLFVQNVQTVRFATISGQSLAWAIISALIPRRTLVGLVWSASFAVTLGAINWMGLVVQEPASAVADSVNVLAYCYSLAIFVMAVGLRFLLGWRLVFTEEQPTFRACQFGIADMIEWTVAIGVFFGLGHLGGWFHNLSLWPRFLAWQALVSFPVVLAIMSRRRAQWIWLPIAVFTAIAATAVFEFWNGWFDSPGASRVRFVQHVLFLATSYVLAVAPNFIVVRWLGFHWATRPVESA